MAMDFEEIKRRMESLGVNVPASNKDKHDKQADPVVPEITDEAIANLIDGGLVSDPTPVEEVSRPEKSEIEETQPEIVDDPLAEIDWEFESELLLRSLEPKLEAAREEFKKETNILNELQKEKDNIQRRLDEINRKLKEQQLHRELVAKQGKQIKEEIAAAEQKLEIEKANKAQQEALAARFSTFEARTKDCPWRTGKRLVAKRLNPAGFYEVPKIMKHQESGSDMIASAERALLGDGMGLGKTLTGVAAAGKLDPGIKDPSDPTGQKTLEGGRNPSLRIAWIGPAESMTDVFQTWKMWSYYSPIRLDRRPKLEQEEVLQRIVDHDIRGVVVQMNYATWAKNKAILKWLNGVQFDMVIVDEAHHMKNISTSTFKGIKEIVFNQNTCGKCGAHISETTDWECPNLCEDEYGNAAERVSSVKYFLAMTGSFILNRPREIYASLHLANAGIFYSEANFQNRFCGWNLEEWGPGGKERLAQQISGFYMRRTRDDAGVELPKQTIYIHELDIEEDEFPLQYKIIDDLRKNALIEIEATEKETGAEYPQFNMLALITRQRQATVWPGGIHINQRVMGWDGFPMYDENNKAVFERVHIGQHYQESAKMNMAMELVDELHEGGHTTIIVSQFLEALLEAKRRCQLRGLRVGELHGDIPGLSGQKNIDHKEEVKRNLNRMYGEEPKYDVVVMHYKTGGESLNLNMATALIVLDEEWNDAMQDQASARLDRTGQTEESQVHILRHVGPGYSIDNWLQAHKERKRRVVSGFNSAVAELKTAFDN